MIRQLKTASPKVVAFKLSGKLHDEDYQLFVPAVEKALAEQGRLRLLAQFEDFRGWDGRAAWDDFKFGMKHYADFDRIAVVGDRDWEVWMARLAKPFTKAAVKYFTDPRAAQDWLQEGL